MFLASADPKCTKLRKFKRYTAKFLKRQCPTKFPFCVGATEPHPTPSPLWDFCLFLWLQTEPISSNDYDETYLKSDCFLLDLEDCYTG